MATIPKKAIITIYKDFVTYRLYKWVMTRQRFNNVAEALEFHKEVLEYNKSVDYTPI